MDWTPKEPVTFFLADGRANRRAELKKRLETLSAFEMKSKLVKLASKSSSASEAYALFEEESSGRVWAAAVITKTDGKSMSYALIPEWENPPYHRCGRLFLERLEESGPSKHPEAEEWRRKCREELGCAEALSTGKGPSAFENLTEGTRIIWTVGDGAPAYLPRGKQLMLEKELVRRKYCWRDMESGAIYADEMIPESDRQVLKNRLLS